ncbi:MAG TPA: response regulator, partial [Actinobacteria bacterium]|nr:response regulator [Actinomycetota bacterium]
LSRFLGHHPFISGVSILSGGEIAVVLNVLEMASSLATGEGAVQMAARTGSGEQQQRKRSVLVVEDSLVVRELQRNILEVAGYEVNTAVDGRDALSRLDTGPVDCIVTDIEMPGMNGFDLTTAIRQREDVREIPVIMVTSLKSDEDKKKGIEVGADAYVVKGSFDQKTLLETIERLVA